MVMYSPKVKSDACFYVFIDYCACIHCVGVKVKSLRVKLPPCTSISFKGIYCLVFTALTFRSMGSFSVPCSNFISFSFTPPPPVQNTLRSLS